MNYRVTAEHADGSIETRIIPQAEAYRLMRRSLANPVYTSLRIESLPGGAA